MGSPAQPANHYAPPPAQNPPFPAAQLDSNANDPANAATRQNLEAIGQRYLQFRVELMIANHEGLTSTFNSFHDPAETSDGILEL